MELGKDTWGEGVYGSQEKLFISGRIFAAVSPSFSDACVTQQSPNFLKKVQRREKRGGGGAI